MAHRATGYVVCSVYSYKLHIKETYPVTELLSQARSRFRYAVSLTSWGARAVYDLLWVMPFFLHLMYLSTIGKHRFGDVLHNL